MNHDERYKLAMKLLKEGKTVNEVVDAFRNEEEFNENVTRYQIQFLRKRAENTEGREYKISGDGSSKNVRYSSNCS